MDSLLLKLIAGSAWLLILGVLLIVYGRFLIRICKTNREEYATLGELVAFRLVSNRSDLHFRDRTKNILIEDFDENQYNRKPLFRFILDGEEVEMASMLPAKELNKLHIGSRIPILCYRFQKDVKMKVIMNNTEQKSEMEKINKKDNQFPIIIGTVLLAIGILRILVKM